MPTTRTALTPEAQRILEELKSRKIRTLEEFAAAYAEATRNVDPAQLVPPEPVWKKVPKGLFDNGPGTGAPVTPKKPILLEGKSYRTRAQIGSAPLHFCIGTEGKANGKLLAFSSSEAMAEHLKRTARPEAQSRTARPEPQSRTAFVESPTNTGYCYENRDFGGARLRIPDTRELWDFGLEDLRKVYRNNFLFWGWDSWNNVITSVVSKRRALHLFSGVDFTGDSLLVQQGQQIADLADFGFNNRASSLKVVNPLG